MGEKVDSKIFNGIKNLCGVIIFLIAIAMFYEVINRYFFGISYGQIAENSQILFIWVVFLIMGSLTKEDGHINVSMIGEMLVKKGHIQLKRVLDIIGYTSEIIFALTFIYCGVMNVAKNISTGAKSFLPFVPPNWTYHLALPVGSILLVYIAAKKLFKRIVRVRGEKEIQ